MLEVYNELKKENKDSIILFKSGSFYVAFDDDAIVLNKIFNYKILSLKHNLKVGFPISLINKNTQELEYLKISYILVENNNICNIYRCRFNKYKKYSESVYNYLNISKRINNITNKLNTISNSEKLYPILEKIEGIING